MTRKRIAILILGLILLACLLACGYFGAKTIRRTYQRRTAMAAYEKKNYEEAERLLLDYVRKDQNSEPEFVALANIYHEFGNTGAEAEMWQMASSLNPLKSEYRENMLNAAMQSANYRLMHSIIGRKVKIGDNLDDRELFLYLISACRTGYSKDAENLYKERCKKDSTIFSKTELGQIAEFLAKYSSLSDAERSEFLEKMVKSEDPVVRYEALYSTMRFQLSRFARTGEAEEEAIEGLLKQLRETNYFAGTPLMADYYIALSRFEDVIELAEPYLKTIDNTNLYLMYLESCVIGEKLDKLKEMAQKFHEKGLRFKVLTDYCGILISYLEKDKQTLAERVRKSGKQISTPLALFIRLQVALGSGSFSEIRTAATEFFAAPPFGDLRNQAVLTCVEYIKEQMLKTENQNDPSQMAELAQILMNHVESSRILTTIILVDQYKKGLVKEADLLAALGKYPDSLLLTQTTAEYLILNGKAEQALPLIERLLNEDGNEGSKDQALFLQMLAFDQLGRTDEAAEIFKKLIDHSQFNINLLDKYFTFCVSAKRENDLNSMADKLDSVQEGKLKPYSPFFRAAALILTGDEAKRNEGLKILTATTNEDPDMAFYAATRLSEFDWLDDAESKYKAILNTYRNPSLIYVNLSELYKAKGDAESALKAAKDGFEKKKNGLTSFVYAQRLSEGGRYDEAVTVLNLPRRAGNYRPDVIELWTSCMKKVIEKSVAEQRYMQAEDQCKHLLTIDPDDAFAKENLEKVREKLSPKKDRAQEQ